MPRVPQAGEVEKKTIVTEFLPAKDARANGGEVRNPDCFDFMEELSAEDWKSHIVYIYRLEPQIFRQKEGDPAYVGCVSQAITRQFISENYGGGVFEIWVKQGRQIMSRHSYTIAGAPKNLDSATQPTASAPGASAPADPSAAMGMRALEMMGGPQAEVFRAMLEMFKTASAEQLAMVRAQIPPQKDPVETLLASVRLMRELNPTPAAPAVATPNLMDELMRPLLAALIQKMTNPANPLEEFKTMAGVMKEIGGLGGGSDKGTLVSDVVRALPGALREATGMVREIRLSNESAARTVPMPPARAANPAQPGNVVTMPPHAAADSGQGPIEVHPPDPNWIKLRVVQMIADAETSAGDVAEWLRDTAPEFLQQLFAATPEQILGYFKTDPVLQHAVGNPRLAQFVSDFVSYLHEVPTTAENAAPAKSPA